MRTNVVAMISMVSSVFYLSVLCILVVIVFLFYIKAGWKILIRSPLNVSIDFFYRRITSFGDRPGKFPQRKFDVQWSFLKTCGDFSVFNFAYILAIFKNHLKTFPWLSQLEANWEAIRDELLSFVEKGMGMCNVHTTGGDELNKESNWKLAMILDYGKPIDEVKDYFPLTLSILEKLPEVQNAAFSLLKAGGSIPAHCGSTASILRYHLALIVPDYGKHPWLTVAGVNIPWEEGKGILFDDTFEHSARNGAREDRVVLIVDIFRPNLGLVDGLIQKLEVWKRTQDFIAGRQG